MWGPIVSRCITLSVRWGASSPPHRTSHRYCMPISQISISQVASASPAGLTESAASSAMRGPKPRRTSSTPPPLKTWRSCPSCVGLEYPASHRLRSKDYERRDMVEGTKLDFLLVVQPDCVRPSPKLRSWFARRLCLSSEITGNSI